MGRRRVDDVLADVLTEQLQVVGVVGSPRHPAPHVIRQPAA